MGWTFTILGRRPEYWNILCPGSYGGETGRAPDQSLLEASALWLSEASLNRMKGCTPVPSGPSGHGSRPLTLASESKLAGSAGTATSTDRVSTAITPTGMPPSLQGERTGLSPGLPAGRSQSLGAYPVCCQACPGGNGELAVRQRGSTEWLRTMQSSRCPVRVRTLRAGWCQTHTHGSCVFLTSCV